MFNLVEPFRSRAVSRLALLVAMSAGIAGCSSDFSRTNESPWASRPQASSQAPSSEVTGSVHQQAAPTHKVETSALPPPSAPTYGGGSGMGSYQAPQTAQTHQVQPAPARDYTGSVSPAPRQPASSWSWDGGTAVIVAQGETIETISRRHKVPVAAILQANNMSHAGLLQPGQRLVIPRLAAAPQVSAPQTRVAGPAVASAAGNGHTVAPGETIYSLARHYRLTPMAIAKANNLTLAQQLRVGQRIIIPGGAGARLAMPAQPAPAPQQHAAVKPESLPAVKQPAQPKVAQVEPPASARVVTPAADPLPEKETLDICASFQRIVVETLLDRLIDAARWYQAHSIGIAGGVSANSRLRADAEERGRARGIPVFVPDPALSTDNAAMIAAAGLRRFRGGLEPFVEINAQASLVL